MDANELEAAEIVSASRKLGREDARAMLQKGTRLLVAKGKKVATWTIGASVDSEAVDAMLGSTGNLRAPTLRAGNTILVGFNESLYEEVFG
ncbi:MAG: ArsC family (seleno)protein [Myxococcota bacterium]